MQWSATQGGGDELYWWVSQNKTHSHSICLGAELSNQPCGISPTKQRNFSASTRDVIFSYAEQAIRSVGLQLRSTCATAAEFTKMGHRTVAHRCDVPRGRAGRTAEYLVDELVRLIA